jgi:hypothetical protein
MRGGNFGFSTFILHYIHRSIVYHVLQFSKGNCVTVCDYDGNLNSALATEVAAGLRLRLLLLLVLGPLTISPSAFLLPFDFLFVAPNFNAFIIISGCIYQVVGL